jgi:hypothetical protein
MLAYWTSSYVEGNSFVRQRRTLFVEINHVTELPQRGNLFSHKIQIDIHF